MVDPSQYLNLPNPLGGGYNISELIINKTMARFGETSPKQEGEIDFTSPENLEPLKKQFGAEEKTRLAKAEQDKENDKKFESERVPESAENFSEGEQKLLNGERVLMFDVFPQLEEIKAGLSSDQLKESFEKHFQFYRTYPSGLGDIFTSLGHFFKIYFEHNYQLNQQLKQELPKLEKYQELRKRYLYLSTIPWFKKEVEWKKLETAEPLPDLSDDEEYRFHQAKTFLPELNNEMQALLERWRESGDPDNLIMNQFSRIDRQREIWADVLRRGGREKTYRPELQTKTKLKRVDDNL